MSHPSTIAGSNGIPLKTNFLKNEPLFKECLEKLNAPMLPKSEADKYSRVFTQMAPLAEWGKIDWDKIKQKIIINYQPQEIIPSLKKLLNGSFDESAFIEWSDGSIPVIKTTLSKIVDHFDDVICVAHEKFIFNPFAGYIIEILTGNEITVGILSDQEIKRIYRWIECLNGLGEDITTHHREYAYKLLKNKFGFGLQSVAWDMISSKKQIASKKEIIPTVEKLLGSSIEHQNIYIVWDDSNLPAIQTSIENVISNFDNITPLALRIWIFDISGKYIIEVLNEEIIAGLAPHRNLSSKKN
jgi:hypothetical protein